MKKGFTLIELLAVIVILAIIALIATPIVLSIIDDSKESSTIRSAEGYLRAVEYEIAQAYVTPNRITNGVFNVLPGGNICIDGYSNNTCTGSILEIEYNNEGPVSGTITLEETKITHYTLTYPSGITVVDGYVGEEIVTKVASGLYDEYDNLIYTWEELLTEGFITVVDNVITGSDSESLTGKLVIDENIINIGDYTFENSNLISITIPDSVTSIGEGAFFGSSATSIILGNGVTSIGDYAFQDSALASIILGTNLTNIGEMAFNGCGALTSVTIPKSVTNIGGSAFEAAGLESITIPESITSIEVGVFAYTKLKSVIIPKSVVSIGASVFAGCYDLTIINYEGTEEEWDAISLGDGWDMDIDDYNINYNYKINN